MKRPMSSYTSKKSFAEAKSIYGSNTNGWPMSAATSRTNMTSGKIIWKLQLQNKNSIKDIELFSTVNEHGIAIFENIPIGVHKICVPEFWDYHSAEAEAWMVKWNNEGNF